MRMCLMALFTSFLLALLFIYPPAAALDSTALHCIVLYPQKQCEDEVYSILLYYIQVFELVAVRVAVARSMLELNIECMIHT